MYEDLIRQYHNLSEEEQNALLVYKSRLGLLINDLDNNPNFEEYYKYYLNLFSNPFNLSMRFSVFKNIDLTSLEDFIASIYKIKEVLDKTIDKLVVNEDTTLYRAVSTNSNINDISKSNIISTSLSFFETLNFANAGENIAIYQINLKKGSHVACVPYAILNDQKTHRIIKSPKKDQEEIILNKDNYEFVNIVQENMSNNISIIEVDAKEKNTIKAR